MKKMGQGMKLNAKSRAVHITQLLVHMLTRFWIEVLNAFIFFFPFLFSFYGSEIGMLTVSCHLPTISPNRDASFIGITKQEIIPEVLNF